MVLTLAPIWCWCWSINFGALGARTFGVGTFGANTHTFEDGVFGVGTFGANPYTFEEGVWCNWIRCTKCNFQMVQQVNGAFHFLLYKSLVLTLTFFKMVLKHSVETHTFEEGVFGVVRFDAKEECVWCNWIRCTKCNFQMVQQVNGAFYFFVV